MSPAAPAASCTKLYGEARGGRGPRGTGWGLPRREGGSRLMITVLTDHREARSGVPDRLRDMGAVVMTQSLPVADYVLSERVGVERKTALDFVTAIIRKRFALQVERLREAYPRPLYVIEGRRLHGLRDVHPNFIRGALATLTVTYCVPTLFTEGPEDTAALLFLIARREQQGAELAVGPNAALTVRELSGAYGKAWSLHDQQMQVLSALPLVGHYRAEQLLAHFGTIEHLAIATEADLVQVPGIGKATAARIRRVISTTFTSGSLQEQPPGDSPSRERSDG